MPLINFPITLKSAIRRTLYCSMSLLVSMVITSNYANAQGAGGSALDQLIQGLGTSKGGRSSSQKAGNSLDDARETFAERSKKRNTEINERQKIRAEQRNEAILQTRIDRQLTRYCRHEIEGDQVVDWAWSTLKPLERDYCRRAGLLLKQFGYEAFQDITYTGALHDGAIQDDYQLGIGDELSVTLRGKLSNNYLVLVDREGRVFLPDLPPVSAAGLTFGQFRRNLKKMLQNTQIGTELFVSLANVRNITVEIVGQVRTPGIENLTGLSTVPDALRAVGGISRNGSLRKVQVERGNRIFWVDLYDVLFGGGLGQNLTLANGDRIIVHPIGATVAVGGLVNRPAIYELEEGQDSTDISDLLKYAGNPLRPRGNKYFHIGLQDDGTQKISESTRKNDVISNGDILLVRSIRENKVEQVELVGHVFSPGYRALREVNTVRGLVKDAGLLKDNPYSLFAVLETSDPATQARQLFALNLKRIFAGQADYQLRDGDKLFVLSAADIEYLSSNELVGAVRDIVLKFSTSKSLRKKKQDVAQVSNALSLGSSQASGVEALRALSNGSAKSVANLQGRDVEGKLERAANESKRDCKAFDALYSIAAAGSLEFFSLLTNTENIDEEVSFGGGGCPEIFDNTPSLLPFVIEHLAILSGEIRKPGVYPVTEETLLSSLQAYAGGMTRNADVTVVEVIGGSVGNAEPSKGPVLFDLTKINSWDVNIGPGAAIRFNQIFSGRDARPVELLGEVRRPGTYRIASGERLSEVIARAGGLTDVAYPYGTVFTRESVKQAEIKAVQKSLKDINSSLGAYATLRDANPAAIEAVRRITQDALAIEPIGRVVIEADPTVLAIRRELDIVLEAGDKIVVPKRPNLVTVFGEVLSPGAQQFIAGFKAERYIALAGGFQQFSDPDSTFVVFPDGKAKRFSISAWNYSDLKLPPGSTIFVPRDARPLDGLSLAKDVTQILSQVAVTIASLAVLNR